MNEVKWYENTSLDTIKSIIKDNINNASRAFMKIGFYLKDVRDRGLYEADGYTSIWEFAQAEFGISKSSASRFMAINDKFSVDGNSPDLLEQYRDFSSSKLQEMLTLTDEQLEQITITTTVAEIRDIKSVDKVVATSQQEINASESEDRPEINPYDDKKPEPGTVIYNIGGSGGIEKYEVVSKDCSFSPKYFAVKDKSESIHNISAESDHWHYSREDAKKDPWYREKISKSKTEEVIPVSVDDTPKFDFWEGTPVVKRCANCNYNDIAPEEFRALDPEGGLPCNDCDDKLNNWMSKIVQAEPELIETVEAEIVQTDHPLSCKFDQEARCLIASKESCKNVDIGTCMYYSGLDMEEEEPEFTDPEKYSLSDVEWEVSTHTDSLEVLRRDNTVSPARYKTKMRMDAATALLDKLKELCEVVEPGDIEQHNDELMVKKMARYAMEWFDEEDYGSADFYLFQARKELADHYDYEKDFYPDYYNDNRHPQQLLPTLKNNDQRKEWIDNYTSWPLWIDLPHTGEKYYRYDLDLTDKVAIVVKVSRKHAWHTYKETKDYEYGAEQYYLLGVKSEWSQKGAKFVVDESRTFYECNTNKSALVEYLKEFQKGAKQ